MIPRIYQLRVSGRKYLVLHDRVINATSAVDQHMRSMVLYTDYNNNREHNDWRVMEVHEFFSRFEALPEDENG